MIKTGPELHRSILKSSMDGFCIVNLKGQILEVNETYCRFSGYSEAELLTKNISDLEAIENKEETARHIQLVMTEGSHFFETQHRHKDGSIFDVEISVQYIAAEEGLIVSFIRDITEKKEYEKRLRKNESRLQAVIENSPDIILQVDRQGIIVFVSRPVPGISVDEFVGTHIFEWVPQESKQIVEKAFSEVFTTGRQQSYETAGPGPHGTIHYYSVRVMPVFMDKKVDTAIYFAQDITDHKRVAQLLNYQFKHSPDTILIINRELKIEMINRITTGNFTVDNIKGQDWIKILPPEHQDEVRQNLICCFETGEVQEFEHPIGNDIWVRDRVVPIQEEDTISRAMIISTDITDHKQTEKDLQESEKLLRKFVDGFGPHIFAGLLDMQGKFLLANRSVLEATGLNIDDVIGKPMIEVKVWTYSEAAYLRLHSAIDRALKGEQIRYDEQIFLANNQVAWIDFSINPLRNEQEQVIYLALSAQIITERKQAEEALRENAERLELLSDNLPHGLVYQMNSGKDGTIRQFTYLSAGIEQLHGITAAEAIHDATAIYGQVLEEDRPILAQREAECLKSLSNFQAEFRIRHPSGKIRWIMIISSPRKLKNNDILWDGIEIDITERKQAELERERLQSQLTQAQKMESVGRLAGGVAHDFNNMLSVISGYSEIILSRMQPTQPLYREQMQIKKAAERSANLTQQLLAFARKQTVAPKILDLNETVEGMLKMLRRLIGEDIDLAWFPGKHLGYLNMDPSQIDQILANLCINARDAIGKKNNGKVTIETHSEIFDGTWCELHAGYLPGEYLILSVSDNGCGIDEELRSHLFEPFFTTKDAGTGTGLGLATIYGIVCQNDGFIDVTSKPDRGTTFKIFLPRSTKELLQTKTETFTPLPLGNETILLVEDEPALMEMTQQMLTEQGYTVFTANTPGEAILIAKQNTGNIHLLITDVVMPEMNGKDLAQKLISLCPGIGCLFMSGYTKDVIAHHGVLNEKVHFLQKPFTRKNLITKVWEILEKTIPPGR